MAYSLSFSDEFYECNDERESGALQRNSKGQPTTLRSAILMLISMPGNGRRRLCSAFRCKAADLDVDAIMDRAREIDTCASIGRNGVPVYLTPFDAGWGLTVTVYEADCDCGQPLNHRGFCMTPDVDGKRTAFVSAVMGGGQ